MGEELRGRRVGLPESFHPASALQVGGTAPAATKYGDQAGAVFEALESAVEGEESYTMAYRKDLSYVPQAGTE